MGEYITEDKYYDAEGELYVTYLRAQMETRKWRFRRQKLLLSVEPESLSEAAALIELIYEFSLTHRINAEKAVIRISDIFDDIRNMTGRTEELMDVANAYHNAHADYWRNKVSHCFRYRWFMGVEWGVLLAVADALVFRTRLLARPYVLSFMSLVMLIVLLGVFPVVYAWLTAPKVSAADRIFTWKMR